jgi:hypothetical protein
LHADRADCADPLLAWHLESAAIPAMLRVTLLPLIESLRVDRK